MSDATQKFRLMATSGYERDIRSLIRQNPDILNMAERALNILEQDPYNKTRQYDVKKLKGVEVGKGQWRIRVGKYRLRYDIFNQDVVLYSFRHRKEAY